MFERSWVQILAPYTRCIQWFVVKIVLFVWKRPKINKKHNNNVLAFVCWNHRTRYLSINSTLRWPLRPVLGMEWVPNNASIWLFAIQCSWVKWTTSTPVIRVRIPLKSATIYLHKLLQNNENKQKYIITVSTLLENYSSGSNIKR